MSDENKYQIFLAQPNAGSITPQAVGSLNMMSHRHKVHTVINQFGDVAHNFNMLWCAAVNARHESGITHFAMLHSDIQVETMHWLDVLLDEMDRVNADVMTTVLAIKDLRGLTTTGIRYPGVWGTRRFVMREILELPETFSIEDTDDPDQILAINTGCWVCRLPGGGWPDAFPGFTDRYRITWEEGQAVPWFDSEDWLFSDWAASQGLRVFATRKVHAAHLGGFLYPNYQPWGQWETDQQAPERPAQIPSRRLSVAS